MTLRELLERARAVPGLEKMARDQLAALLADAEESGRSFERFHWGRPPDRAMNAQAPDPRDGTLTSMGELVSVAYEGTKGRRGELTIWEHPFERRRPILAHNAGGRLIVVGGDYRITRRGIEG